MDGPRRRVHTDAHTRPRGRVPASARTRGRTFGPASASMGWDVQGGDSMRGKVKSRFWGAPGQLALHRHGHLLDFLEMRFLLCSQTQWYWCLFVDCQYVLCTCSFIGCCRRKVSPKPQFQCILKRATGAAKPLPHTCRIRCHCYLSFHMWQIALNGLRGPICAESLMRRHANKHEKWGAQQPAFRHLLSPKMGNTLKFHIAYPPGYLFWGWLGPVLWKARMLMMICVVGAISRGAYFWWCLSPTQRSQSGKQVRS